MSLFFILFKNQFIKMLFHDFEIKSLQNVCNVVNVCKLIVDFRLDDRDPKVGRKPLPDPGILE